MMGLMYRKLASRLLSHTKRGFLFFWHALAYSPNDILLFGSLLAQSHSDTSIIPFYGWTTT